MDASSAMANDTIYQIQQQLNILKKSTQECGIEIEKTRQMQEHHSINFYKHHQISGIRTYIKLYKSDLCAKYFHHPKPRQVCGRARWWLFASHGGSIVAVVAAWNFSKIQNYKFTESLMFNYGSFYILSKVYQRIKNLLLSLQLMIANSSKCLVN